MLCSVLESTVSNYEQFAITENLHTCINVFSDTSLRLYMKKINVTLLASKN